MGEAKNTTQDYSRVWKLLVIMYLPELLDSSHYGVPQTRKRVIFIAVREDVTDAIGLTSR